MSSRSEGATDVRRPLWQRVLARRAAPRPAPPAAEPPAAPERAAPEAPPGFDWQWYVEAYTDLPPAGITDEASAIRHWREHGRREGRRFAPRRPSGFDWLTYVDHFPAEEATRAALDPDHDRRPAPAAPTPAVPRRLVCPSVDSLFLRAWGDLVCWDDAGAERILQAWDPRADYAERFLDGPWEDVRRSVDAGRMPWPSECERCLLLRLLPPEAAATRWNRRDIRMLRVEPSYLCSLDCPGCVPLATRRLSRKIPQLDPDILDRILADLLAGGLAIQSLDFQGHGEPLLNPRLWEMARRSRERLPGAWISVTTSAQARCRPEMLESGLDEIICSIDGCDQETYAPYRVHGDFELAWRLVADLVRGANESATRPLRVVWKYVLFEHNSSPAALARVQRMALEVGVSELVFVVTRNGPAADHIRSPADIERIEPGPPLSFRFHEPSANDLDERLAEAARLEETGREADAAQLTRSVRSNLARFHPQQDARPVR